MELQDVLKHWELSGWGNGNEYELPGNRPPTKEEVQAIIDSQKPYIIQRRTEDIYATSQYPVGISTLGWLVILKPHG